MSRHLRAHTAVALAATLVLSACADGADDAVVAEAPSATAAPATDAPAEDADATSSSDGADEADGASESTPDGGASEAPASPSPAPAGSTPAPASSPTSGGQGDGAAEGDEQRPIPAGTYAYDTEGWRQVGEQPREDLPARTTFEASAAGGDDVQRHVRDLRDDEGHGSRTTTSFRYGVEGVVLLGTVLESTVDVFGSPFTSVEEFDADPPVTVAPRGGGVGFHADLRLVGDDVTITGTLDVVREEQVTVGGEVVDAYVVEVVYDLSGSIEGRSTATWWVRPADLLRLREETRTDVESRGIRYQEQYEATLTSLTPA